VPSLWPEPFGIIGLEAMARRRAVVGSMTGGIGDWLQDGVTGLGVRPGDVAQLREALARILDEPALQVAMGAAGRAAVEEQFSEHAHVAALQDAFAAATPRRGARARMASSVGERTRPDAPVSSVAGEPNKLDEIAGGAAAVDLRIANYKPFGHFWGASYFTKWAVISHALFELGLQEGQTILDVGVGGGWTTVFLSETGFQATGVDIAPGHVSVGRSRANRYGASARFEVADMDTLDLGTTFDAVLVFDALHHTRRQREVVGRLARHVKPGGWILFGEPTWLHAISPHARRASRQLGWVERGVLLRTLKRDCRDAGLTEFRRFYEGTAPFSARATGFAWELARLVGAQVNVSPRTSLWLAARRR